MIANSQGSSGEELLLLVRLLQNIGGDSNGRGPNTSVNGNLGHLSMNLSNSWRVKDLNAERKQ